MNDKKWSFNKWFSKATTRQKYAVFGAVTFLLFLTPFFFIKESPLFLVDSDYIFLPVMSCLSLLLIYLGVIEDGQDLGCSGLVIFAVTGILVFILLVFVGTFIFHISSHIFTGVIW